MSLPLQAHIEKDGFRLRGTQMSRVDGFSDVVFGFALTLLVVSLEVPKTFAELHHSLRGFLPFAISFFFLMMIWYAHFKFFRRFGLHDFGTIAINAVLLFVVLFYVYPLKFLFTFIASGFSGQWEGFFEDSRQLTELMVLYGIGFASIYILLAALYWNAYRQRHHLELNTLELFLNRVYILENAGTALIGLLSCAVALLIHGTGTGLAGWVYFLIYPFRTFTGRYARRKSAAIQAAEAARLHARETPPQSPDSVSLINSGVDGTR